MSQLNTQTLRLEKQRAGHWGNPVPERLDAVKQYAGRHVLDVGCATGQYIYALTEQGYLSYGVDILPDNAWARSSQHFSVADIHHLPFKDESFETVLAFEVLEHLDDTTSAVKECHRIACTNIIVSVPNCQTPDSLRQSGLTYHHWVDRSHKQAFSVENLVELLTQNGFKMTITRFINPIKPEFLVMRAWHIPSRIARVISRLLNRIPVKKHYYMTILAVADKK